MRRPPANPAHDPIVDTLLTAYRAGMFPMADGGHIGWYTADPRGILPLAEEEGLHIPRSTERAIRRGRFTLRCNTAFGRVMASCAAPRSEDDDPWIDPTLIRWYSRLHAAGHAHSIEAWLADPADGTRHLVGGIYGVAIGAAFFGESMFCAPRPRRADGSRDPLDGTDASKVCLITLVRHLRACGFTLFDTQMVTPHVATFGGRDIPAAEYAVLLDRAVSRPERWKRPDFTAG